MARNKTCHSWRAHLEDVGNLLTGRRHRCRKDRDHGDGHDCGRLPCFGSPARRWAS